MPYGLTSDQHCHNWTSFATTDIDGVNSRLRIICNELERAADETLKAGGQSLYGAGDLLHVRGSINPTVLNPLRDTVRRICDKGIRFRLIPGNHDLESRESDEIGNAVRALMDIKGVEVCDKTTMFPDDKVIMVPWYSTTEYLLAELNRLKPLKCGIEKYDLIIHAPVDEVVAGIPSHGLTAEMLADIGFKRVFAGHYHHHKDFGNGVYSIGATTHQAWGDVGSKAGFLIVGDDVTYRASWAPQFIDVNAEDEEDEATIAMRVDGNYVRFKGGVMTEAEIKTAREGLLEMGANGVVVHAIRESATERPTGGAAKKTVTLDESVSQFIKDKELPRAEEVDKLCSEILIEARSTGE